MSAHFLHRKFDHVVHLSADCLEIVNALGQETGQDILLITATLFLDHSRPAWVAIESAWKSLELVEFSRGCHHLRGMAGHFGPRAFVESLLTLEEKARVQGTLPTAEELQTCGALLSLVEKELAELLQVDT